MFNNYINYSFLFFKLWGINKLLLGIPYYIVEHLILQKILNITYQSGKMLILGIGSGIYYIAFPKPIEVIEISNNKENINI